MPTLDKVGGGKPREKSKTITVGLPKSNPNIKTDIDAELDQGWHIATSFYDVQRDEVRIIFTKPKRN
jgi:hypothetical protein